ncbi:hypothetical protein DYB25_011002 [Aphanomyces astaci]|uniref:Uncharacterized protein n=1 Tax=Aphanomyces astaci TaxID=112090 RepID=A0A397BG42_APHAT|nr:hypothetical protein DYB36_011569 [Aphanomyces astaci]RHY16882.1 hypothetical protein DYB25_011002 [Aphanomyces astaci]
MTTIAPTTQTFNDDIDATGVAQQRPRGEPVHAGTTAAMPSKRRANAAVAIVPTTDASDGTLTLMSIVVTCPHVGQDLRKTLNQSIHDALRVLAFIVFAMSTLGISAALIMAVDRRFRGLVASVTSQILLVGIALSCATASVAVSAYNGDATPLQTLFKPIQDPINLSGIAWAVMVKGFVIRLASLSIEAIVVLVKVWQPVDGTPTVTERVVRGSPPPTLGKTLHTRPCRHLLSTVVAPRTAASSAVRAFEDVLSEQILQEQDQAANATTVQALSGAMGNQVSFKQDTQVKNSHQALTDLEPATAVIVPKVEHVRQQACALDGLASCYDDGCCSMKTMPPSVMDKIEPTIEHRWMALLLARRVAEVAGHMVEDGQLR